MYKTAFPVIPSTISSSSAQTYSCHLTGWIHVNCVSFGHFTVWGRVTQPRFRETSLVRAVSNYLRPVHCTTRAEPNPRFAVFRGSTVTNSGHNDPPHSVIPHNPRVCRVPQFVLPRFLFLGIHTPHRCIASPRYHATTSRCCPVPVYLVLPHVTLPTSFLSVHPSPRAHFSKTDPQQHPRTSPTALRCRYVYITLMYCKKIVPHNRPPQAFTYSPRYCGVELPDLVEQVVKRLKRCWS